MNIFRRLFGGLWSLIPERLGPIDDELSSYDLGVLHAATGEPLLSSLVTKEPEEYVRGYLWRRQQMLDEELPAPVKTAPDRNSIADKEDLKERLLQVHDRGLEDGLQCIGPVAATATKSGYQTAMESSVYFTGYELGEQIAWAVRNPHFWNGNATESQRASKTNTD